jgi:uncharacterized protein (TIGR03086 family)
VNEVDVFELADRTLARVVAQIRPAQWEMVMPPEFATPSVGERPTLRDVVNYHAYEDAWVPDMVAGRTMDEVGRDAYRGDLLGEDPASAFDALVGAAVAAVRSVTDLTETVHCSFGDFPVREYLWQMNGFRGLRAHDIAAVVGVDVPLPPDLVQGLWEEISPTAEQWRAIGVFPAAVPVSDDAPLLDRLLGLTGRQPDAARR